MMQPPPSERAALASSANQTPLSGTLCSLIGQQRQKEQLIHVWRLIYHPASQHRRGRDRGRACGERQRERLTGAEESAAESHHLYPALYPYMAKMNHSPGEKEPETTEPLRYLR